MQNRFEAFNDPANNLEEQMDYHVDLHSTDFLTYLKNNGQEIDKKKESDLSPKKDAKLAHKEIQLPEQENKFKKANHHLLTFYIRTLRTQPDC